MVLIVPEKIILARVSLNFLRLTLTSLTSWITISFSNGIKSLNYVSSLSSNQVLIKMPESFCRRKFSAKLSMMMVFVNGLPILDRSLMMSG